MSPTGSRTEWIRSLARSVGRVGLPLPQQQASGTPQRHCADAAVATAGVRDAATARTLRATERRIVAGAQESGGRQPQHPSRSDQPLSLCPDQSRRTGSETHHEERPRFITKVQMRPIWTCWGGDKKTSDARGK